MAELKAVAIAYEQERATVAELIDAVAAALVEHGPAAENELASSCGCGWQSSAEVTSTRPRFVARSLMCSA